VLQVRSDCPPARLLEFLAGESGLAANEAAESVASSKAEEEALLEKVLLPFPSHIPCIHPPGRGTLRRHSCSESPSRVFSLCSQALSACCVISNTDVSSNIFKRWSSTCVPKLMAFCCNQQGIAGLATAHPSCVHDEGQHLRISCPGNPAVQLGESWQYLSLLPGDIAAAWVHQRSWPLHT
jgi:hypothetical protein